MSSFSARRKARIIKADEDEDADNNAPATGGDAAVKDEVPKPVFGSRAGRKPFRQSGLRKTATLIASDGSSGKVPADDDDEDDGPVVVRPALGRSKQKKRPGKSSKLSFGVDEEDSNDGENSDTLKTKKVPLSQRALENNALKRGIGTRGLPLRSLGGDDERPKYSKEYLQELQSSTPNTPQNITTYPPDDSDGMDLDASELEGALIVDGSELGISKPTTKILTEAEIQEKKERRVRLAQEEGFLSVEDEDEDRFGRKKKEDTRLMAEDEDLGEGFDNFVEDGGLSLGKRAEKERRKQERQKMAELITAAEGHTSDSSSDSDAERRIAYEAAQTRAGLDGLKKPKKKPDEEYLQVPPKITPLPSLTECLLRLQATLKGMENELKEKVVRVEKLETEREDIVKREAEVQALLDDAGKKYQEAMGHGKVEDGTAPRSGLAVEVIGQRGLENLGTPARKDDDDDEMSVT